jgi:hypothetical protein
MAEIFVWLWDITAESIGTREEYNKLLLMLQQKESTLAAVALYHTDYIICVVG